MNFSNVIRVIGAVVASVVCIVGLLIAVEGFSAVVHPFPTDYDGSMEQTCLHVARYPNWVLAAVIPMWTMTAFLGTWIAGRLGNRGAGIVIGLFLLAALAFNMSMLPYPVWFEVVQFVAILAAVAVAIRFSKQTPALA